MLILCLSYFITTVLSLKFLILWTGSKKATKFDKYAKLTSIVCNHILMPCYLTLFGTDEIVSSPFFYWWTLTKIRLFWLSAKWKAVSCLKSKKVLSVCKKTFLHHINLLLQLAESSTISFTAFIMLWLQVKMISAKLNRQTSRVDKHSIYEDILILRKHLTGWVGSEIGHFCFTNSTQRVG